MGDWGFGSGMKQVLAYLLVSLGNEGEVKA